MFHDVLYYEIYVPYTGQRAWMVSDSLNKQ
jgi:hypothetical protein